MLRAEIAHLTCEQIARGGLLAQAIPARCVPATIENVDARMRAEQIDTGNRETCARAVAWLTDAGDIAAAEAVREHMRAQWGRFAACAEAAE